MTASQLIKMTHRIAISPDLGEDDDENERPSGQAQDEDVDSDAESHAVRRGREALEETENARTDALGRRCVDAFVVSLGGWIPAVDLEDGRVLSLHGGEPLEVREFAPRGSRAYYRGSRAQVGQVVAVLDVTPTSANWLAGVVVAVDENTVTVRALSGEVVRLSPFSARLRPFTAEALRGEAGVPTTLSSSASSLRNSPSALLSASATAAASSSSFLNSKKRPAPETEGI